MAKEPFYVPYHCLHLRKRSFIFLLEIRASLLSWVLLVEYKIAKSHSKPYQSPNFQVLNNMVNDEMVTNLLEKLTGICN